MKKIVLNIQVLKGTEKVIEIPNASPTNVQSCIDLWHDPGTEIKLLFDEVEVSVSAQN